MEIPGTQDPEGQRLQQAMRDLVALSTLPAIWGDLAPEGVIDSLAGVLLATLDLDLVYVRVCEPGRRECFDAVRSKAEGCAGVYLAAARDVLDTRGAAAAVTIPDPAGGPALSACVIQLGIGGDIGSIVAGSRRPGFPLHQERLLLGVAANQAAVVLQRHLAKRAVERGESRFLEFADAAPAMLWVTQADGSCSFLSRGWYAFTGQGQEEGLGYGWIEAVHPDDRQLARQYFLEANAHKKEFSLEHRLLHADGSYRWVIDAGRPRFSAAGDFLGFVGNVLDINDRKEAEQAARAAQGMLSAVFEALPVGVAVAGQDGKVRLSNQEMQQYLPTGLLPSFDDARRERWRAVHADGRPFAREEFAAARALRGERVVPGIEARFTRDDGSEIWTQIAAVPLAGSDGKPDGQVTVVTNIDAFKRTEAALRLSEANQRALFDELARSNKNLSEFLAVLAHELRNPLAPIVTGLEIMRLRANSADVVGNVRGIMERQVRQLTHLIDDLLDIARVTNGKLELKKEIHDLKGIVSNAVETSLPLIEKGGHAFGLTLPPSPLPVSVDATRIAQVIANLLTNAAKYTPAGGSIRLAVEREDDEAVVSVADNGIGIPAASLGSLFDMFSQVGQNMAHAQGGLGIGLSLVRQLVTMHGGAVSVASEGAGKGSTFTVRLPLALAETPAAPAADAAARPAAPDKSLRVLVVDDNVDAATTLAALLGMHGHELLIAHDGPAALQIASEFHPDVVFLDIGMPGMSGHEVARALRKMTQVQRSVLVAVSGWGAQDDLLRSKEAGFDLHLTKPVNPARVSEFLDSLH